MNTETTSGKEFSLGIDNDANLYVNGNRVTTEKRVKLEWWVNVAVILGALGGVTQGIFAALTYFCK